MAVAMVSACRSAEAKRIREERAAAERHAEQIVHERYAVFDAKRREQEAIIAEQEAAEDLKVLEAAEKQTVAVKKARKKKDA